MLLSLIQLLAGIGVVLLLVSYLPSIPDTMAILTGLLGAFAWVLVAYGLFAIETVNGTGSTAEPALALFAAACALVTVLPAFINPFEIVGGANEMDDPMERI